MTRTVTPPRSGSASWGRATGTGAASGDHWNSVAWSVRTGTAGENLLRDAHVIRRAAALAHLDVPAQAGDAGGDGDVPAGHDGFAGAEAQRLRRERRGKAGDDAARLDRHRARRRVADREVGMEAIALAHERRQPGQQHQVLRGAERGATGAELREARGGDGLDAEAGERVVQRHLTRASP